MGQLTQAEESLFARWEDGRAAFVKDGVVDEAAYRASSPRMLFLLKEVNSESEPRWDLREFLRDGGQAATWDTVTRWVLAIRALPAELSWSEISLVSAEQRVGVLRSLVAVNVKKSPGGHTTNVRTLRGAVKADAAFIREQISIYEPHLIICCGSDITNAYNEIHSVSWSSWESTKRGVQYLSRNDDSTVIAYSHPEARIASNVLHYGLVDGVRDILRGRSTPRVDGTD